MTEFKYSRASIGRKALRALACSIVFFCRAQTFAGTIYDNGAPLHFPKTDGFESTLWINSDDFILSAPTRVESVKFWDLELLSSGFKNSVVWAIYANGSDNTPGALLFSGTSTTVSHVATGFADGAYLEYLNTVPITPVALPAGTYWVSLHNGPLSSYLNARVYWELAETSGVRPSQSDIGPLFIGDWSSNSVAGVSAELTFQIAGTPLPQTTSVGITNRVPGFSFSTVAGATYRVEYKNALADATWTPVAGQSMIPGNGQQVHVDDPDPAATSQPRRFYRVVLL